MRDGKFVHRVQTGRFNAETFLEFLKVLAARSVTGKRRVIVISDNAHYHKAKFHQLWREQRASRFALDFLPPYSPELNPIERVWKLTRRLCLHNRYFGFLEGVIDAVEYQFHQWTDGNETLRRLCAII